MRIKLALFAWLTASLAAAQAPPAGPEWLQLQPTEKAFFVIGFAQGHFRGAQDQRNQERTKDCGGLPDVTGAVENPERRESIDSYFECIKTHGPVYSRMRASDSNLLVSGLDELYSDYANQRIPISFALEVIQDRISGLKTDAQFQASVETLRQLAQFQATE